MTPAATRKAKVLGRFVLLTAVLPLPTCHLDASGKVACDTEADCMEGNTCENGVCTKAGAEDEEADAPLRAPSALDGVFVGQDYELSWEDNSVDETGFEVEQQRLEMGLEFSRIGETAANETRFSVQFSAEGAYVFRVRAVKGEERSAYCESDMVSVFSGQTVSVDMSKLPTEPLCTYQRDLEGVLLSWEPVDFKEQALEGCGYHVYRRRSEVLEWSLLSMEPAKATSYRDLRAVGDLRSNEYAVAAYNGYGESTYWTYSE